MSKRNTVNGQEIMIFIGGKVVALSTDCTVTYTSNETDSATKDDGDWDNKEVTSLSYAVSTTSMTSFDESAKATDLVYDDLMELWLKKEPVAIVVGKPSNYSADGLPSDGWKAPATGGYSGRANISKMTLSGKKGEKSTIAIDLTGVGKLVKLTV